MANRYVLNDVTTNTSTSASTGLRLNAGQEKLAQDITALVTKKYTYCALYLAKVGSPTGNMNVKIYATGANPTAGTLLKTITIDVSTLATSATKYIFDIASFLDVTSGGQYYFVIDGDYTISASNYVLWYRSTTSVYAGGSGWIFNGSTWAAQTYDFDLLTYSNADGGTWEIDTDGAGTWVDPDGVRGTVYPCTKAYLETLKGGAAMHSSDTLCVYNAKGAIAQDGETWPIKIISLGEMAGATWAPTGQKNGYFIAQGGSTISYLGDATNTNSGIKGNPAGAATESKNIELIYDKSNGKDIYENNSSGTLDTNKRHTRNMVYGRVRTIDGWNASAGRWAKTFVNNSYSTAFFLACNSAKTAYGQKLKNTIVGVPGAAAFAIVLPAENVNLEHIFDYSTADYTGLAMSVLPQAVVGSASSGCRLVSGGKIKYSGTKTITGVSGTGVNSPVVIYPPFSGTIHYGKDYMAYASDVMQTEIRPDGFALAANGKDGQLVASWTNGSAYTGNDEVFVFSAAGALLGMFTATVGSGVITGLTTGTTYAGVYACATSDGGNTLTAKSATASATPFDNELISITPNIGSIDGNTTVTIEATGGMTGATSATVNGVALTDFAVVDDTTVTGKTGAMTAGQGNVVVTTPLGTATLVGGFTAQTGVIRPGEIVLTTKNTEYNKILVSWEGGFGSLSNTLYRDGIQIFTTNSKNSFEDTVSLDTEYDYEIIAENDAGQSSDSSTIKSWSVYDVPEDTPVSDMVIAIRDSILQIKNNGSNIFTDENVVVGRILNHDGERTYPCCEIYPAGRGASGDNYESQREIAGNYAFEIWAYEKIVEGSESRDDGDDMASISKIGSAIIRQMFSFIDKKTDTYPCKGFLWTNPNFTEQPVYELIGYGVNSVGIQVSFRVDSIDTEL